MAALEVYERRALISYDIEGLLHEQMNNISAVMFKFHLPEAHPNRQIVLPCPDLSKDRFPKFATCKWGRFKTISDHNFANYINFSHKTEVQTAILRC